MRFQYVFGEAFRNMRRNILVVLGAILAVFISLGLTYGTVVLGEVARLNTVRWTEEVRVIAFISDDFRGAAELQAQILEWDDVADVIYMSKAEALDEARDLLQGRPTVLELIEEDPSILPASLRVRPVDPDNYNAIEERLRGSPGLEEVLSAGEALDNIVALRDGLGFVFWVLAGALGIAAVALVANTIHMAIYARREEIEIMRLVGASAWYIRVPFLVEGVIEGLVGGTVAVGVIYGVHQLAVDRLEGLPEWINIAVSRDFFFQWGAIMLGFGLLVGLIGSGLSLAVHRQLRA